MKDSNLIPADTFCVNHHIDYSFIQLLDESGLIKTSTVEHTIYIPEEQLPELEKIVRLHFDMDINIEGIETINYLLDRIQKMQQEIAELKNRLGLYE